MPYAVQPIFLGADFFLGGVKLGLLAEPGPSGIGLSL